MLEEIFIRDGIAVSCADGDRGHDGGCVVSGILVMARELDGHAGRIWFGDIAVAVAVQVGNESPVVVNDDTHTCLFGTKCAYLLETSRTS